MTTPDLRSALLREDRPPLPPRRCLHYHGVPGCRCQVSGIAGKPHHGPHHCEIHDYTWSTDALDAALHEMYVDGTLEPAPTVLLSEITARILAALATPPPALDDGLRSDGLKWRAAEAEGHVVTFTATGFGLQHPPSCRPDLIACEYNQYLAAQDGPDAVPGRYRMTSAEPHRMGYEYARLSEEPR